MAVLLTAALAPYNLDEGIKVSLSHHRLSPLNWRQQEHLRILEMEMEMEMGLSLLSLECVIRSPIRLPPLRRHSPSRLRLLQHRFLLYLLYPLPYLLKLFPPLLLSLLLHLLLLLLLLLFHLLIV